MKFIRVVDQAGNGTDYESDHVPRIGEHIMLSYGPTPDAVRPHFLIVHDVMYLLENEGDHQAAILVIEDREFRQWLD